MDWLVSAVPPAAFAAILLVERRFPERDLRGIAARWIDNVGLYATNGLLALLVVAPCVGAIGDRLPLFPAGWLDGCFVAGALGFILIDLLLYGLHRLHHAVPLLWRFHAVHHSDGELDATTGLRHHPGEFLTSSLAIGAACLILGIPLEAVATYGAVALSVQMVQHANVTWPARGEILAEWILVTPRRHRRHHSVDARDQASNYGTILCVWDRLFGTYRRGDAAAGAFGVSDQPIFFPGRLIGILLAPALSRNPRGAAPPGSGREPDGR